MWLPDLPPLEGLDNDYRLLVNEIMRLMLRQELFTFVTAKPASSPTARPNRWMGRTTRPSERCVARQARQTGRTNKTDQRRPPPNDSDQCPGIAASLPADLHAFERARGVEALVGNRAKLLRGTSSGSSGSLRLSNPVTGSGPSRAERVDRNAEDNWKTMRRARHWWLVPPSRPKCSRSTQTGPDRTSTVIQHSVDTEHQWFRSVPSCHN